MTLKGPSDVWLGVGMDAQSMDYTNADVIIYSSSGLKDYYLDGDNAPQVWIQIIGLCFQIM